ncbi:Hypothetical protein A7982_07078 [Minicystis rosea]|nr:Hypothetical protein A7982_07078 [Minicystis rosea]
MRFVPFLAGAILISGCGGPEVIPWAKDPNAPSGVLANCKVGEPAQLASGKPGIRVTSPGQKLTFVLPARGEWRFQCDEQHPFFAASMPNRYILSVLTYESPNHAPINLESHLRGRLKTVIRNRAQNGLEGDYARLTAEQKGGGQMLGFYVTAPSADGRKEDAIFLATQPAPDKVIIFHYSAFYANDAERVEILREVQDTVGTFSLLPDAAKP